jgi:hypothetical protein
MVFAGTVKGLAEHARARVDELLPRDAETQTLWDQALVALERIETAEPPPSRELILRLIADQYAWRVMAVGASPAWLAVLRLQAPLSLLVSQTILSNGILEPTIGYVAGIEDKGCQQAIARVLRDHPGAISSFVTTCVCVANTRPFAQMLTVIRVRRVVTVSHPTLLHPLRSDSCLFRRRIRHWDCGSRYRVKPSAR